MFFVNKSLSYTISEILLLYASYITAYDFSSLSVGSR